MPRCIAIGPGDVLVRARPSSPGSPDRLFLILSHSQTGGAPRHSRPAALHRRAHRDRSFGSQCGRSGAPSKPERPRRSLGSGPGPLRRVHSARVRPMGRNASVARIGPGVEGQRRRGPPSLPRSAASTARAATPSCGCARVATGGRSRAGSAAGRCAATSPFAPPGAATSALSAAGVCMPSASVAFASARRRK
jgi:hypothetical protein